MPVLPNPSIRAIGSSRAVLVAAAITLAGYTSSSAQQSGVIGDAPTCSSCSIRIERVGTLSGPHVVGQPESAVRMPDGRLFIVFYPHGEEISEFSASGEFVRIVAPNGKGPGEVNAAMTLERIAADTILAYDSGRILRFSPTGRFIRSDLVPTQAEHAVWLGADRYAVNAISYDPEVFAQPLQIFKGGRRERAFGAPPGLQFKPDQPYQILRELTSDGGTGFWAARPTAYRLEHYDSSGTLVGAWDRTADWFEPYWTKDPIGPDAPPTPWLSSIRQTGPGQMLVLVMRPTPDWKRHLGPPRRIGGGRLVYPSMDLAKIYWTTVELVDVERGRLIAAGRAEGALAVFADDSHALAYRQDEQGNPFIDILRITVADGSSR